jgi:multidrug efflux pump subunit AcrA (membrane-fusion protein)
MGLFDKLKGELESAGKAAQGALDEGRLRLDIYRVRQSADRAAQALGYAVHRARKAGAEPVNDEITRLTAALAGHEAEAERLEEDLRRNVGAATATDSSPPSEPPAAP